MTGAFQTGKDLLSHPNALRRHFHRFIFVDMFQSAFQREGLRRNEPDGIITASGMAQSLPFALELLRTLAGEKAVEKVAEGIQL